MRACRPVLLLLLGLLAAGPSVRAASVYEDLNRELAEGVIVPGYERFAAATTRPPATRMR